MSAHQSQPRVTARRTAQKLAWTAAVLWALVGCGTAPLHQAEGSQQPGTLQDDERQRLAHTRLQLGAMHLKEGRAEIALGEVTQALHAYPNYPDAYNLQGWIYLSERDYTKADASFERALSLRPGDPDTRYNLGWSQCQQKNFAQAQTHFDLALQAPRLHEQSRARTLLAKGVCLRQAGQAAEALPILTQAYELDPDSATIGLNYAQALYDNGDWQRARFHARRLNQSQWADAASLWLGVRIERKLGDTWEMRQLANQLERRFPTSLEWRKFEQGAFDD